MRISFEQVMIEGDKILFHMTNESSTQDIVECWEKYIDFITACGWSNQELDEEILKRVNDNWGFSNSN